ncbi:MAG: hypothetical protein KC516_03655 [Nanoarchaeota archaeon]|nr:hypothetical protein [Nanoarchaeota archaeon]
MKNKKAAMEMSVGTIVTIVLLMSVLVLGIFLIQGIFKSAKGAVDLTDQQLQAEIGKLFESDAGVVIYPTSKYLKIKVGEIDQVGIGIKNIAGNTNVPTTFSYVVKQTDNDCGLSEEQVTNWISLGRTDEGIPIPISGFETTRATFKIPESTPTCLADFRVEVYRGGEIYDSEYFTVEVKA